MARQVVVIDDLDGTPGAQSVRFQIDKVHYTIDLAQPNAERLRALLAPYIAGARSTSPRRSQLRRDRALNPRIREWAADQGIELNAMGRIPNDVVAAYRRDHEEPDQPRRRRPT